MAAHTAEDLGGPHVWGSDLDPERALFTFSDEAQRIIRDHVKASPIIHDLRDIETLEAQGIQAAALLEEVERMRREVEEGVRFVVVRPIEGLSTKEHMGVPWILGSLLGKFWKQNVAGDRLYLVTDRGERMEEGARYSQTSQGGAYHTDGVNQQEPYEYVLLNCVSSSKVGGESVFISGAAVYNYLHHDAPEALSILSSDFLWEYKGLRENEFYKAPVVKLVEGEPLWRYLRPYMEEAAAKNKAAFPRETVWALDALDAALELSELQFRYTLGAGETAVFNDRQIFHGRTSFANDLDAISFDDFMSTGDETRPIRRSYLRLWVSKET